MNKISNVVRLGTGVSAERLAGIRRELELNHCKWDAQVGNQTSLADAPLLMSRTAWFELSSLAERLFDETVAVEVELLERQRPAPDLESVLLAWQGSGLELWRLAEREPAPAEPFHLRRRSWFLRLLSWLDSTGPRRRWDGLYGRYWPQSG